MALSGSVSTNAGEDGRYYKLSWTATQSIANNTSTISWTLEAKGAGSSWLAERTVYVNIDGSSVYSKSAYTERYAGTVASGTKTLSHNSDGTRSFSVSLGAAVYYSSVTCTGSDSFTLNTIARKSDLTVGNGTLGSSQTISASRKSSSFTHTLTWKCGSYSGTMASKSSSTSWSFTPELKLAEGSPNGTSVYCSFTLTTYNGSSSIGSVTKSVQLSIPSSVVPTCSLKLSDAKGYAATYGGYIQGQSTLSVTVNAAGKYGSTISAYSTSANGSTYTSKTFETGPLKTSGSNTINTTVKDSRGRTVSASSSITVIPYSMPKISSLSVYRCNSDGTENDRGSYAKIVLEYSVTSLSNKNTNSAVLKYKKTSESVWTQITITPTSYNMSYETVIAADDGSAYDILLEVTDAFTTSTSKTSVSTGFCLYHIPASGKGITYGGIAESDGFNVHMKAHFSEDAHFSNGITEDIRIYPSGDCNTLLTSGNYYIGSLGKNKPGDGADGWLTVKSFNGGEYCYQEYVTYKGARYFRMRDNGTWGTWIRSSAYDIVVDHGTSGNWRFTKWASGDAELWYYGTVTPTSTSAIGSGIYTNIISLTAPFGVTGNVCITGTAQNLYFLSNTDWSYANKTISFRLQRQKAMTLGALEVMLYVSGKWKV